MQGEFALRLRGECHKTRIVRARADFGKPDLVAFYEQLDTEETKTTKGIGDLPGHLLCPMQRGIAHWLWLPALYIVAVLLPVTNRLAEHCSCG